MHLTADWLKSLLLEEGKILQGHPDDSLLICVTVQKCKQNKPGPEASGERRAPAMHLSRLAFRLNAVYPSLSPFRVGG